MTGNWLDLLILGWLALGAIRGIFSGLIRSSMRIVAFLLAAGFLYPVSQSLGGRLATVPGLADRAASWLQRSGALPDELARLPADYAVDYVSTLLAKFSLPSGSMPIASPGSSVEVYVGKVLLQLLFGGMIFLLLLGAVYLLADVAGAALQAILGRLPFLGFINRLGGAALGIGEHAIIAALVVGVIAPILSSVPGGASDVIRSSAGVEPLITMFRGLARLVGV